MTCMAAQLPPWPRPFQLPREAHRLIYSFAPGSEDNIQVWLLSLAEVLAARGILCGDVRYWLAAALSGHPIAWRTEYAWPPDPDVSSDSD